MSTRRRKQTTDPTQIMRVVEWVVHNEMLIQHIQNGVARGLYTQGVADQARDLIYQHNLSIKESAA